VTPSKLKTVSYEEICKISRDYAITAIETLAALRRKQDRPLRFVYVSGHFAVRNPAEVPKMMEGHALLEYGLMRVRILVGERASEPPPPTHTRPATSFREKC
jgi:hypothetical protein